MVFPKSINMATPSSPLHPAQVHIWRGQGANQHHQTTDQPISQPYKEYLNTSHFMGHIKSLQLHHGECFVTYDVKALLILVPVDANISIVKNTLLQDPVLPHSTPLSIQHIIILLEFCLKYTYCLFHGKYYEQVHAVAMGSPISPLVAKLFMEEFESKAINSSPICPGFGLGMQMMPLSSNRKKINRHWFHTLLQHPCFPVCQQ